MNKVQYIALILLTCFSFTKVEAQYKSGEIIVQFAHGVKPESILSKLKLTQERSAKSSVIQLASHPINVFKVKVSDETIEDVLSKLRKHPEVVHVQKNAIISYRKKPNDLLFNDQWQYNNTVQLGNDLNILPAWDITTGGLTATGDTIVIAVLEDGIGRHDDIVDNLWVNHNEIPGDKIDNDGNGYVDDYWGWNVDTNSDNVNIDDRHGTQVAGIIGAVGNNNKGVSGINWNVKIMPIVTGDIDEANAIAAYSYAYVQRKLYNDSNGKKGAFIVATNSSWGIDKGKPSDSPLWCAFYDSLGSVGILSCAATANANIDVDVDGDLPTACPSDFLIAVTNVNRSDIRVGASGYGKKSIDLGAFGENTYNISSSNRYSSFSGTSAATPHVTGAIALAYSVPCDKLAKLAKTNPAQAARILKQALLTSTKSNNSLFEISRAQGRLDIGKFIATINSYCANCADPIIDDVANIGEEGKIKVSLPAPVSGVSLDLRIRALGTDTWVEYKSVNANSIISNIDLCTDYEYQVKSYCEDKILNDYRYSRFVTSFGCCPIPKVMTASFEAGKMQIDLLNQELAQTTVLEYKKKDEVNWINLNGAYEFNINNLPECTFYEYRLTHSCLDGRSLSPITNQQYFNTDCYECTHVEYCENFIFNNKQEWISSVTLGETVWETGKDLGGHGKYLGYKIPTLDKNKIYKLEIIPGFSTQSFQENFKVYIDFNNDRTFTTEELVYKSEGRKPFVKDTIIIPSKVLPGIKRMRVIMNFEDRALICNGGDDYGEIEEYCIEISNIVSNQQLLWEPGLIVENTLFYDRVNIKSNYTEPKDLMVRLFDSSGRAIIQNRKYSVSNSVFALDNLGDLVQGVYILNLVDMQSGQQTNFKLIKTP